MCRGKWGGAAVVTPKYRSLPFHTAAHPPHYHRITWPQTHSSQGSTSAMFTRGGYVPTLGLVCPSPLPLPIIMTTSVEFLKHSHHIFTAPIFPFFQMAIPGAKSKKLAQAGVAATQYAAAGSAPTSGYPPPPTAAALVFLSLPLSLSALFFNLSFISSLSFLHSRFSLSFHFSPFFCSLACLLWRTIAAAST